MDEQSKATLDAILAQEPAALSESDVAFLRARRSYLSEVHRDKFAEFLGEEQPAESEAPKKAKKSKEGEE